MDINLEKLKKQTDKLYIRSGMFKYYPSRNIQHNGKHIRVNRLNSLFVAQIIKINSLLANNVGVDAIPYDYFFDYDDGNKTYIYCEVLPEHKKKIDIPKFYDSIQGYEFLENIANDKTGKEVFLQAYLKQVLFALFIGDYDRNWSNLIAYFDNSKKICLYPMFDFDECFAFGSKIDEEILYSFWYLNDKESALDIKKANEEPLKEKDIYYTDDNWFHKDFLRLLTKALKEVEETDYFYDVPSDEDQRLATMLFGNSYEQTNTLSSIFEFCYSKLEDKDFINRLLGYNLESLFDVQDNHGFNKRTKLFYLSLMEIQKNKFKRELEKLETKKII